MIANIKSAHGADFIFYKLVKEDKQCPNHEEIKSFAF